MSCPDSCPNLETVAAWCLGELPEPAAEGFEEHYFACERCLEQAERMLRLVAQLRVSLPPVLTAERRRALEAARPALPAVRVQPGERAWLRMSKDAPVGLWLMQAGLQGVTRVDFEARTPEGELMFALRDVPFDAARGEVALACQLHYRALSMPTEMHAVLTADGPGGQRPLGRYILDHEFESRDDSL
jgi:anti-sigma factor RsiW